MYYKISKILGITKQRPRFLPKVNGRTNIQLYLYVPRHQVLCGRALIAPIDLIKRFLIISLRLMVHD